MKNFQCPAGVLRNYRCHNTGGPGISVVLVGLACGCATGRVCPKCDIMPSRFTAIYKSIFGQLLVFLQCRRLVFKLVTAPESFNRLKRIRRPAAQISMNILMFPHSYNYYSFFNIMIRIKISRNIRAGCKETG